MEALTSSAHGSSQDASAFRQDLLNIARTTLSSKVLSTDKDYFAELAVNAVMRLKGSTDLDHIQIIKKTGGKLRDSYLDEGFILDKRISVNCPRRMENAKILIANTSMDTDKIKIFGAKVKVDSTGKLAEVERAEKEKMKAKVQKIKAHGINCFVNRQLVYNYPESIFAQEGIMCIEHADFEGVERLALVTGGEIASTFERPDLVKLGQCDTIEEIMIGEDRVSLSVMISHAELTNTKTSSSSSLEWRQDKRVPSCCAAPRRRWLTKRIARCTTPCRCYHKQSKRRE